MGVVAALLPGHSIAAAQGAGPTITAVSPIVAQNDSDLPDSESSGPGVIITGSGFGATVPTVTDNENDTTVGESAIGLDTVTGHLQIEDTSTNSWMGLYPNDDSFGDCNVSIGLWTDTEIVVLLDDTGGFSCSDISAGDVLTFQVWDTNEGAGPGVGNPSNLFTADPAVAQGTTPDITCSSQNPDPCGVSPASGPIAGGTFNDDGSTNASGTITLTGTNLSSATAVWFGNGGDDGAVATTAFTVGAGGTTLTVTPPPAPGGYDEGVDVVVTTPTGTSVVPCTAIDEGCAGTYYYQSPSQTFGPVNGSTGALNFNGTLSLTAAIPQSGGACPGSAGGTGISFNASAVITGGPVSFSGTFQTSENDDVLSSVQVPVSVDVQAPVTISVSLSGTVSGCYAIPIPDLTIPGLGGLYVVIGGNITAAYTLTVTLNQGTWIVDGGYVPNQLEGAVITSQNCTDGSGNPAPCIQSSTSASISGTLDFSPLWLGINISASSQFVVSVGAGLTVAAFVTASTATGFDYDVCLGGTYDVTISAGPVSYSNQGTFFGPFNIYGDGTQCPLGSIGSSLPSTSVTVGSSANPAAVGQQVTYTATVSPTDGGGTVSFSDNGAAISSCEAQAVDASGAATCQQTYTATGSHDIVATYSGDASYAGSASSTFTQQVNSVTQTTTTLASSVNPSTTGQQVTYTATVSPTDDGGTVAFTDGGTTIPGCDAEALDTSGTATCSATYSATGSHSIVATYSGDTAYGGSASQTLTQVVNSSVTQTTTTLASSANPSSVGQQVTYTATVSPTDDGGTVAFTDGGTTVPGCGSEVLDTSGQATCSVTYSATGSHTIVATYGGDTAYGGSTSSSLTQTVSAGVTGTTTTLASSANPSKAGQQVTYTATVSPTDDGGTVAFTDDGTTISGCGTEALNTSGQATCATTYASAGSHSIVAAYSGDTAYGGSTSQTLTQVVGSGVSATSTTLASSANPSALGQEVTYTATVSPTDGGGTVAFTDGGTTIAGCGSEGLVSGQATCSVTYSTTGSHPIVASYSGDTAYSGSTSATLTQVVKSSVTATTTSLASSVNPSKVGQQVTYTATVSPTDGGGTVTFRDGGSAISGCSAVALDSSDQATCAVTYTKTGSHSIVAAYSGDTSYGASTSATLTQVVQSGLIATTTTLASSANPSTVNQVVTYTATVAPSGALGTVRFSIGGTTITGCSAVALNSSGTATCEVSCPTAGSYTVVATYSGNSKYAGSVSEGLTEVVQASGTATATSVTASPNPAKIGQKVTVTATVSPKPDGGTLAITDSGGSLSGCSALTLNASGSASCTVVYPKSGVHPIIAIYSGDATYSASTSATLTEVVGTAVALSATATPREVTYGTAVALSAKGLPVGATGKVVFTSGSLTLCKGTVASGAASCATSTTLPVLTYAVTATYTGNDPTSTATTSFTINKARPTMTASVTPTSVAYGTAVTLTVSGLPTTATGTVFFTRGTATLCQATVASGGATCTSGTTLVPGSYAVVACYHGDSNFEITDAKTSFTVTKATVTITATASPTTAKVGTAIKLKVTGLPSGSTGSVLFKSGTKTLCSVKLTGATSASCSTSKGLAAGTYKVTASYTGNADYDAATATTKFTLTS